MFTVYIRWFWAKWGFISCFTSVWVCPAASFSCLEQEEKGHCLQWVWLRVSMENIIHRALAWAVGSAPILLFACLCVWSFRKSGSTSGRLSTHPWGPTKTHSVVTHKEYCPFLIHEHNIQCTVHLLSLCWKFPLEHFSPSLEKQQHYQALLICTFFCRRLEELKKKKSLHVFII